MRASWRDVYESARASRRGRAQTLGDRRRVIEAKIEHLRVSWESGARTDEGAFRREVAALKQELEAIGASRPPQAVQRTASIASLADRWEEMEPSQRRRLVGTIFESITMKDGTLVAAKPKADWMSYLEQTTAAPQPRGPLEGLAGIEPATPALGRRRSIR